MGVKPPGGDVEADATSDSAAKMESAEFGRLAEIEGAKHAVKLAVHKTLSWLVPLSVILAFVLFWVGVVVYAIHLFTPYGWLKPVQLQDLHTILFSSVIGAVVAQGIKRYLD
jgi:hypothetical protein